MNYADFKYCQQDQTTLIEQLILLRTQSREDKQFAKDVLLLFIETMDPKTNVTPFNGICNRLLRKFILSLNTTVINYCVKENDRDVLGIILGEDYTKKPDSNAFHIAITMIYNSTRVNEKRPLLESLIKSYPTCENIISYYTLVEKFETLVVANEMFQIINFKSIDTEILITLIQSKALHNQVDHLWSFLKFRVFSTSFERSFCLYTAAKG